MKKTVVATLASLITIMLIAATAVISEVHASARIPAPADPVPTGLWNVTVQLSNGMQEHALTMFLDDGGFIETNTSFPQPGLGRWIQTSPTTFEATFIKQLRNDQGSFLGTLHIHLAAHFTSSTHYVGNGLGQMYDPEGNLVGTTHSTNDATRVAFDFQKVK